MELARLRMIKSPAEIELSRAAVRLNEEAMWAYLKEVRPGALESDALAKGYAFAIGRGAEDQYWMSGSGNPAVVSHAVLSLGRTYRWKDEDNSVIVIEVSDTGGHYGEIWQPLKLGARDLELEEALAAVVRSIQAAAEMIRSGNTVGQRPKQAWSKTVGPFLETLRSLPRLLVTVRAWMLGKYRLFLRIIRNLLYRACGLISIPSLQRRTGRG